jgi:hypothetical protein
LAFRTKRRRWASVNLIRSVPVATAIASFSVRTSFCAYPSCPATRSLIADAIVAIKNAIGSGSIACSATLLSNQPPFKLPKPPPPWHNFHDDFSDITGTRR